MKGKLWFINLGLIFIALAISSICYDKIVLTKGKISQIAATSLKIGSFGHETLAVKFFNEPAVKKKHLNCKLCLRFMPCWSHFRCVANVARQECVNDRKRIV